MSGGGEEERNDSPPSLHETHESPDNSFVPMLYQFRVTPPTGGNRAFALQQPFATMFDNLIAVLWSVYSKRSKIQIGITQLQWALEFLRCMKVDYSYPESIANIVSELEEQLIQLYARVGEKLQDEQEKKVQEQTEKESENNSKKSAAGGSTAIYESYNEEDILEKLDLLKMPLDPITGEAKYLKELNSLGKRKSKNLCPQNKSSKTYMISVLQKILKTSSEVATKTGVEDVLKELKVENSSLKK